MKVIDPDQTHPPFDAVGRDMVAALARRQRRANGLLMQAVNYAGSQIEGGLRLLPRGARRQIETVARTALTRSYDMAARSHDGGLGARFAGDRTHRIMGAVSGAIGGFGGLPTALIELPFATTMIFRAVQGVAAQYGEDPRAPETRIECLRVFGAGGPAGEDDGIDTSFLGARLSLSGPALHGLIGRIAPRFATVLSQKLAAQAVPVLGAAAGAGTNYAFMDFYVEMAHVHFGLRQAVHRYGEDAVLQHFHKVLADARLPARRT